LQNLKRKTREHDITLPSKKQKAEAIPKTVAKDEDENVDVQNNTEDAEENVFHDDSLAAENGDDSKLDVVKLEARLLRQRQKIKATGNEVPTPIKSFEDLETR
jgi:hypothetical protein